MTFTFVLCRIAMQFPQFGILVINGATATIWVSWTVPLFVQEIILQCCKTA